MSKSLIINTIFQNYLTEEQLAPKVLDTYEDNNTSSLAAIPKKSWFGYKLLTSIKRIEITIFNKIDGVDLNIKRYDPDTLTLYDDVFISQDGKTVIGGYFPANQVFVVYSGDGNQMFDTAYNLFEGSNYIQYSPRYISTDGKTFSLSPSPSQQHEGFFSKVKIYK